MSVNYKQLYAKKKYYEDQIKCVCPNVTNESGIYIFTREENGIKYAYIGQAVKLLDRLVSHMMGYKQWIDLSIRKHKLYNSENKTGWGIDCVYCREEDLNKLERAYIKEYADNGYQLRNVTIGGQDEGKYGIENQRQRKGYRDGVHVGRMQVCKELKNIIDKHLQVVVKRDTISDSKALDKFWYTIMKELEGEQND